MTMKSQHRDRNSDSDSDLSNYGPRVSLSEDTSPSSSSSGSSDSGSNSDSGSSSNSNSNSDSESNLRDSDRAEKDDNEDLLCPYCSKNFGKSGLALLIHKETDHDVKGLNMTVAKYLKVDPVAAMTGVALKTIHDIINNEENSARKDKLINLSKDSRGLSDWDKLAHTIYQIILGIRNTEFAQEMPDNDHLNDSSIEAMIEDWIDNLVTKNKKDKYLVNLNPEDPDRSDEEEDRERKEEEDERVGNREVDNKKEDPCNSSQAGPSKLKRPKKSKD